MISATQLRESNILRSLQRSSEARGLKFYINPPREVIPEFLGDFQPDAIAIGPDGGLIIEVKVRGRTASKSKLAPVAKRISEQKGWEFRAIYMSPSSDESMSIAKPTAEQLQTIFNEIDVLAKAGHSAPALLLGWAALESLSRLASAEDEIRSSRAVSPVQAVQTLAEEGYIENDAANRLREMAKLRNAVVHGDFSVEISDGEPEYLLDQLRTIESAIMSETSK